MNRKQRRIEFNRNQQRVRDLERELESARDDCEIQRERIKTLHQRLLRAGMDPDRDYMKNLPTKSMTAFLQATDEELKGIPYGTYAILTKDAEEHLDQWKQKLVESLVKGMVAENLIRFIYRKAESPFDGGYNTLAARIDVVPWEQITDTRGGMPFEGVHSTNGSDA